MGEHKADWRPLDENKKVRTSVRREEAAVQFSLPLVTRTLSLSMKREPQRIVSRNLKCSRRGRISLNFPQSCSPPSVTRSHPSVFSSRLTQDLGKV